MERGGKTKGQACLRWLLAGLCVLVLLPFLLGAYFFLIAPLRNDRAARELEQALQVKLVLAQGETLVETASFAGNTGGTGNHVELWAGALLFCEGTPGEDRAVPAKQWDETNFFGEAEDFFPALAETACWDGYYIAENYGDAVTQWDNRGH